MLLDLGLKSWRTRLTAGARVEVEVDTAVPAVPIVPIDINTNNTPITGQIPAIPTGKLPVIPPPPSGPDISGENNNINNNSNMYKESTVLKVSVE